MANPNIKNIRNGCYLCVAGLLTAPWVHQHKRDDVPRSLVSSRRADRVLDRSEPICEALARPGERLQLTAEYLFVGRYPARWAAWDVDCVGEDGRMVAHLDWDAATQQLQMVSTDMPHQAYAPPQPVSDCKFLISERAALVQARRWLRIAGMDVTGSNWQFELPAHSAGPYTWIIGATARGTHVIVHLDACTGHLFEIYVGKKSARLNSP